MGFRNRVRLPIKLHKPQFITEREEYRRADGITKTLFVIVRKVYDGQTDSLPEKLHERLVIAFSHDEVIIEGDKYIGEITLEGSYDIEWSDFLSKPIAQAKFKANVTPYNASNSNCGTCETYTQVVCVDDNVGTLDEGDLITFDALENDNICCSPVDVSIVTFNATFVDSITVEPDNNITIQLKTPLPDANGVILATYRAQCENGLYDEANIIANIEGTDPEPSCLAPTNLQIGGITDTYAQATWDAPSPDPGAYDWELHLLSNLGVPILVGNITDLYADLDSLTPGESYRFYVRGDCGTLESNFIYIDFTTNPPSGTESCGQYFVTNNDFIAFMSLSYVDCNGDYANTIVGAGVTEIICALQTSPGNPVEIMPSNPDNTISYIGLC